MPHPSNPSRLRRRRCWVNASCDWLTHRSEPEYAAARKNCLDAFTPFRARTRHSEITTTATSYLIQQIASASPSRRAFVFARSSITQRTFSKCAVALATDRRISSILGSAPTRPKNFDALISSPTTSTKILFAKVCLLFNCLDFYDSYRQQLRVLAICGAEFVAAFTSRTSDLSKRANPGFSTDLQLDLAVDHIISGFREASSHDYLRRERA